MSEATNKTTASKTKDAGATAKTVDKSTTEQTPQTEPKTVAIQDSIKGAFVVTAKTDAGFWRSGVKFKRLEKTLVLVLAEDESGIDDVDIVGYEPSHVVCLSAEKAERVHSEKNLVVTEIDLDELKVK